MTTVIAYGPEVDAKEYTERLEKEAARIAAELGVKRKRPAKRQRQTRKAAK